MHLSNATFIAKHSDICKIPICKKIYRNMYNKLIYKKKKRVFNHNFIMMNIDWWILNPERKYIVFIFRFIDFSSAFPVVSLVP